MTESLVGKLTSVLTCSAFLYKYVHALKGYLVKFPFLVDQLFSYFTV